MTYLKKLQLCILCGLIGAMLLDYWAHDLKQLYAIIVTYAVSSVYIFICIKILKLNNKVTLISAITLSAIVMFIFLHVLPQFTMWQIEFYVIFYQKIGTVFQKKVLSDSLFRTFGFLVDYFKIYTIQDLDSYKDKNVISSLLDWNRTKWAKK